MKLVSLEITFLKMRTSERFPTEIVEFWMYIQNIKNFNDCAVFPNLPELALVVLTLPHGNAGIERV